MEDEQIVDDPSSTDDKPVTEEDLRDLKYPEDGVETPTGADEPTNQEEDSESTEEPEGEPADQITEEPTTFTKKFPHIQGATPEEYAKNLEAAYDNSTAEFHKLRTQEPKPEGKDEAPSSLADVYFKQKLDEEVNTAFADVQKNYPQIKDQVEYDKFIAKVNTLSKVTLESEKRLAPPSELYAAAAVLLGWHKGAEPSEDEKLGMAVKDGAATSKSTSAKAQLSKSKVTQEMISLERKLYPGITKTDAEIRKDLEEHVIN